LRFRDDPGDDDDENDDREVTPAVAGVALGRCASGERLRVRFGVGNPWLIAFMGSVSLRESWSESCP
jgi:hypothetical protein